MPPAAYKDLCLDARDPLLLGRFRAAALGLEPAGTDDGDAVLRGPTPQHAVADPEGDEFCAFPCTPEA